MKHLSLFNLDTACFPGGSTIDHWTVKKQAAWKREGFLFKGRISLFGELLSIDKSVKVRQNNSRYLQQKCIKLTKIFTKQRNHVTNAPIFYKKCKSIPLWTRGSNDWWSNFFCGMINQQNVFNLISIRDHYERFSPSRTNVRLLLLLIYFNLAYDI